MKDDAKANRELIKNSENELKSKNQHLASAKEDLKVAKISEEANKTLDSLKRAFDDLHTSNKRFAEESIDIKKELSKIVECSKQTYEKQETKINENEDETFKNIACKYFNTKKGCECGSTCWFSHENLKSNGKFWQRGYCRYSTTKCFHEHQPSLKGPNAKLSKSKRSIS